MAYKLSGSAGVLQESDWVRESADDGRSPSLGACQAFMAELAGGSADLFEDVRAKTVAFYNGKWDGGIFARA